MKMIANAVCFLLLSQAIESANILGFFPTPSISHQVVFQPIWKELALRGHQVTVMSPNILRENITNLKEIDIGFAYEFFSRIKISEDFGKMSMIYKINGAFGFFAEIVEAEFQHPEVLELIKSNDTYFDVVLVEAFIPLVFAFGGKYNAPVVGVSSLGATLNGHDSVGNPAHPVISPDLLFDVEGGMTFFNRLRSFIYNVYYRMIYQWYWLPKYDKTVRKYFGESMPYLGDLEKNISVFLQNVNPLMHTIRPNVPAVVEISQMHIKPKKPLPDDIKKFLDESKEGVIYFSLGSNVKSVKLPKEILETFKTALGMLPYKVLWKWESDVLPGKPGNVVTRKWLPQQDILGHPNIKAFVTQGGIQSIEEAISNGVPMVGIPFFADQPLNVMKLVELNIAKGLNPISMTAEALKEAILDVAQNKTYKENILKVKSLLTDQPMSGLQKAIWWIEYVIRHKGARHLVSPARDMPLWKYFCLDVIGFLLVVVGLSVFSSYKAVKAVLSLRLLSNVKHKTS